MPGTYAGTNYRLNSSADATPYIELPWQQANNVNVTRFQGKNDIGTNGWELVRRDLGFTDAGLPQVTSNPFVIIYNKYLGVLRVFVTVQKPLATFQFAEVKLMFSTAGNSKAATLNRQSALGVALEDTEQGQAADFSVVSRYLNDGRKWFVADFPMEYDPCVCQFDSRLQILVNLIKQANVSLQATSTGSIVTSQDASAGTSNGPSFFKKTNGTINAAGTSYDSVDKLTSSLKADGATSAVDQFATAIKDNKFLQNGLASLPYLGAAVGLLDFFTGGGQDSTPQPLALQPLAIKMSTSTTGTIKDTSMHATPYFFNPGNRLANTRPSDVPNYNETLGILSIITRPVVDFNMVITQSGATRSQLTTTTKQTFRLTQDIPYVLNPASGMRVQDFQVALVAQSRSQNDGAPNGDFSTFEGRNIQPDGTFRNMYRTNYYDAACIKNSKFLWMTYSPNGPATPAVQLFIKIMVNLRPLNASPTQQNVLFVARYPLTVSGVSAFATLPTAACGVLAQASTSAVQAVCSGSKYTAAVALRGHNQAFVSAPGVTNSSRSLLAYPNPATSSVRFSFTTTQPGPVRLVLSDALGREVRRVVEMSNATAGTFDTTASVADLRPGIYYCTLQTPGEQVVQKLVVAQ